MTIFVGNLSHQVREEDLNQLFSEYGSVTSVKIIKDHETGRSKGFGFVEMDSESSAQQAIDALHETDFQNRPLVVNKARPKTEGGSSGGGGKFSGRRDDNRGGGGRSNRGGDFNRGGGDYNRDRGGDFNRGGGDYNRDKRNKY